MTPTEATELLKKIESVQRWSRTKPGKISLTHEIEESVFCDVIIQALQAERRKVWEGLKVTNKQLEWALTVLGPTGTNAEAYIKAAILHVIDCRAQADKETP